MCALTGQGRGKQGIAEQGPGTRRVTRVLEVEDRYGQAPLALPRDAPVCSPFSHVPDASLSTGGNPLHTFDSSQSLFPEPHHRRKPLQHGHNSSEDEEVISIVSTN